MVVLERPTSRRGLWVVYGLLLAVGIYLFVYVVLFLAVHLVVLLASPAPRRTLWAWGVASGIALLAAVPLLVFALREHGQIADLAGTDPVSPPALLGDLWFGGPVFATIAWATVLIAFGCAARRVWMRGGLGVLRRRRS